MASMVGSPSKPIANAPAGAVAVAAVRRFNRFYAQQMGVVPERYLGSDLSLAEVRILFELAQRGAETASRVARELELDPGYLSRLLARFRKRGWIQRMRSESDSRQLVIRLSAKGHAALRPLDREADRQVAHRLSRLSGSARSRLIEAMKVIESLLAPSRDPAPFLLRPPRPGDFGWVIQRHGALYAQEYAWDEGFEGLVAGIVADFIKGPDFRRQRCWIAERDGDNVGCIFCVQKSETVAQLRLLLVEPAARGLGIGGRLVSECIGFAKSTGYRKLVLWTNDVLHSARRLYERAGFRLVRQEPHRSFGRDLVGQYWEVTW
jgi:DNA-binding MarR family transcriptional regulator/GNAT superfamily N-acetyltransferase